MVGGVALGAVGMKVLRPAAAPTVAANAVMRPIRCGGRRSSPPCSDPFFFSRAVENQREVDRRPWNAEFCKTLTTIE
jgi:hypothetical protein